MTAAWIRPLLPEPAGVEATQSPVDLPGDIGGEKGALAWTSGIVATASLVLLLLNAGAIRGWASELAPAPLTEPAIVAADRWYAFAHGLGLDAPVGTMRGWWREAQAARFAGSQPQR